MAFTLLDTVGCIEYTYANNGSPACPARRDIRSNMSICMTTVYANWKRPYLGQIGSYPYGVSVALCSNMYRMQVPTRGYRIPAVRRDRRPKALFCACKTGIRHISMREAPIEMWFIPSDRECFSLSIGQEIIVSTLQGAEISIPTFYLCTLALALLDLIRSSTARFNQITARLVLPITLQQRVVATI